MPIKKVEGCFPVLIEIQGEEIQCWCSFCYTPGDEGSRRGHPDLWYEATSEEIEFYDLEVPLQTNVSLHSDQLLKFGSAKPPISLQVLFSILSSAFHEYLECQWRAYMKGISEGGLSGKGYE